MGLWACIRLDMSMRTDRVRRQCALFWGGTTRSHGDLTPETANRVSLLITAECSLARTRLRAWPADARI